MDDAASPDIDDSVQHLAELHHKHERSATPAQRTFNRITRGLGRPASLAAILALIAAWIAGNAIARGIGIGGLEAFPFPALEFVATVAALVIALLILTTQSHQEQLAERRAQLTLQIAILSERKIAKIIGLLEEQRRENPMLESRVDAEAEAMATSVDPRRSLAEIDKAM